MKLTKREQQVLDIITNTKIWRPPTYRDIANIIGIHHSRIGILVRNLKLMGLLDEEGKPIGK